MVQRDKVPEQVNDIELYLLLYRALIDAGHSDFAERDSFNTIFGQQSTQHRSIQAQSNFEYAISSDDYDIYSSDGTLGTSGTGNYGVTEGVGFVETGNGTTGEAVLRDVNRIRYRPGHESSGIFTAIFTPEPNTTLRIGIFDFDDGFYIGHDGNNYVVCHRRDGVDQNIIPRSNWDDPLDGTGDSGLNLDLEKLNIFRISFGYLGTAPVFFEVYGGVDAGWVSFHSIDFTNSRTTTNIERPSVPLQMDAIRTTDGGNGRVGVGSWLGYNMANHVNDPDSRPFSGDAARVDNLSGGVQDHIVTIRVRDTFHGATNKIEVQPLLISGAINVNDYSFLRAIKNGTFSSPLSYTDVDTENSVTEIALEDNVEVTGGDQLTSIPISTGGGRAASQAKGESGVISETQLKAGDTLSVVSYSPSSPSTAIATLNWKELF